MELKNKYSIPPKIGKKVKIKTEKLFTFVFSKNISDWMPKVAETRGSSASIEVFTGRSYEPR